MHLYSLICTNERKRNLRNVTMKSFQYVLLYVQKVQSQVNQSSGTESSVHLTWCSVNALSRRKEHSHTDNQRRYQRIDQNVYSIANQNSHFFAEISVRTINARTNLWITSAPNVYLWKWRKLWSCYFRKIYVIHGARYEDIDCPMAIQGPHMTLRPFITTNNFVEETVSIESFACRISCSIIGLFKWETSIRCSIHL